eukprot:GEMP01142037.1.p1 GENE.GEMP01142037.1~~GEMP01142037.1.p1  ORF type:complete len:101 (+),score=1.51 GEMP01142037.1:78-380(+)
MKLEIRARGGWGATDEDTRVRHMRALAIPIYREKNLPRSTHRKNRKVRTVIIKSRAGPDRQRVDILMASPELTAKLPYKRKFAFFFLGNKTWNHKKCGFL